jgi:hypothetical protein
MQAIDPHFCHFRWRPYLLSGHCYALVCLFKSGFMFVRMLVWKA